MSAALNGRETTLAIGRSQARVRDGIHKPAPIKLEVEFGPGTALLLGTPVAVGLTILLGWVLLTSLAIDVFASEMIGAAIVSVVGGTLAALPVFAMMKRGTAAICRGALMGMAIRCGSLLGGFLLAMGPGWGLSKMPLAYWLLACYFPVLIVETALVGWVCQKSQN